MLTGRRRKIVAWIFAAIVLLPLLAIGGGYIWWSRSLPKLDGEIRLAGLDAGVRVIRDKHGVPHIFAGDLKDAARTLGYLHAQDRFFQMDITRRVLQGRLAETIGPRGLPLDRLYRTLDLAGRGRASYAVLPDGLKAHMQAYADGVNAWLQTSGQALPLEYTLLGFEPEPWRPGDAIIWGKGMAWKLSANWRQDATRAMLAAAYGRERTERLFPPRSPEWPITLQPEIARGPSRGASMLPRWDGDDTWMRNTALLDRLLALPSAGGGASNEWVVDGTRSATGKPILANDPHLELDIPILWYLVRVTTPEITLSGATAPGAPLIVLGQNGHIAWGFTTTDSDTQDLFVETQAGDDSQSYLTPDGPQPIRSEKVTIKVKGESSVELTRRETRHGPIISDIGQQADALAGEGKIISLAWTGLARDDTTADALFQLSLAKSWQEFLDAMRAYRSPAQNIVYADRVGNIGFINAGLVPIRKSGDGRYPADGASGVSDWSGEVPFEGWPKLFNPPAGAIVNSNNAVIGPDYPYWFGRDQTAGYRAIRIIELLGAKPRHDLDSMAAIQTDIQAAHARDLVPFLLKLQPETELERQALKLLAKWDFSADHRHPEPLILDWWLRRMNEELLKSGLDPLAPVSGALNASVVVSVLREPNGFCRTADAGEDCMKAVRAALQKTLAELSSRYGADISKWRWGDEHVAVMENQVLDNIPGFRNLFGVAFPSDGGFYSVNRGGSLGGPGEKHPLLRKSGAGFRGIYDLADPTRSRFIIATGQSGHPLSPFYADQLPLYKAGRSIRLDLSEDELKAEASGTLIFRP